MKCVFVNVQTTGLDARTSEVVELATMTWNDGKCGTPQVDQFRALAEVPDEIKRINGYDDAAREQCATFRYDGYVERVLAELAAHDNVLVACNPDFVLGFVRTAAERRGIAMPQRIRTVDVSSMAVPLFVAGKVAGLSLAQLAVLVGRPKAEVNSALDIVQLTRDVFEKLFALYYGALK